MTMIAKHVYKGQLRLIKGQSIIFIIIGSNSGLSYDVLTSAGQLIWLTSWFIEEMTQLISCGESDGS